VRQVRARLAEEIANSVRQLREGLAARNHELLAQVRQQSWTGCL
jgi:hypothetical protein